MSNHSLGGTLKQFMFAARVFSLLRPFRRVLFQFSMQDEVDGRVHLNPRFSRIVGNGQEHFLQPAFLVRAWLTPLGIFLYFNCGRDHAARWHVVFSSDPQYTALRVCLHRIPKQLEPDLPAGRQAFSSLFWRLNVLR